MPVAAIRASDLERERTAALLRDHYLEGRLDSAEFQERLDRCMSARTLGDLHALSADLPAHTQTTWRRGADARRRRLTPRLALAVPLLAVLIVLSALTGRPLFFPVVPILFLMLRPWWWRSSWGPGGRPYRRGTWASP
jgi:hypothetical protein